MFLILAGSALMVINIIQYARFVRGVRTMWGFRDQIAGLYIPVVLLVLFLAGYLFVGLFGHPDAVVAGILFGGSVFVFIIIRVLSSLSENVHSSEHLRIDLQAAKQANEAKTQFLSNMSHDIRTPLNAVIGYSTLAKERDADEEELRGYIDKIGIAGRHLLDLINDVLEMSRIESGRMHLDEKPEDLVRIAEEAETVFADQMRAKGLTFTVDTSGVRDRYAVCDRVRCSRMLMNLISNAYKFTPEGGYVTVTLSQTGDDAAPAADTQQAGSGGPVSGQEDHRAEYVLSVRDNGIGMSEEFAGKVFDLFERERTSTVSAIQGTGLGMAITRSIVEMMGGTIEVRTEKDKGTEFIVRVSMLTADHADDGKGSAASADCRCADGMRVLLAEDVEVNREIAVMMLTGMGFIVDTAADGREAAEMIMASEPGYYCAVLMDIQMPVMDGYEATELIRSIPDPELASVPVIAVTANAFAEDIKKTEAAGMNGHIAKPLDPERIREVLKGVIGCEME